MQKLFLGRVITAHWRLFELNYQMTHLNLMFVVLRATSCIFQEQQNHILETKRVNFFRSFRCSTKVGHHCHKNYFQRQTHIYLEKFERGISYLLLQTMHHHRPNEMFWTYTHNNSETKYTSFYSAFPFATSHTLKTWTRERKQSPVAERALWDTDSLTTTHSPPPSPPLSLRKRKPLSARRIQGHAVK